ncbi:MAG: PEGA domain-containing protein [Lachnospiraceae bacterium]|nr:PEGA domain-containing protein [Lachnospiraceae bacterium]
MTYVVSEKNKRKRGLCAAIFLSAIMLLCACGPKGDDTPDETQSIESSQAETERVDTGFILTGPDSFDSADTALLVNKDKEENTVTFLNLELGRRYTLSYDGTTRLYDKYGESVSMDQLPKGSIVDVTFLKSKKHLTTMQLSDKAWKYENVERYEINTVRGEVSIGSEVYKLSPNTQYLSGGRDIELMDLNPTDIVSFQGLDSTVLSVTVEKGHGYLRLVNDTNFVGGWIEIGQSQIQRITEDMLLVVAEGSYQVNISHNGGGGIKNVIINRNEETTLDIGDLVIPEPEKGMVIFTLSPSSAEVYIDGVKTSIAEPVTLEYGIHQLIAKADGYKSVTQYIRVNQESVGVNVVLDPIRDEEEEESSESSTEPETTTDYYKVYIDAPEQAEVYLDGNYVGISPCSFKKAAGSHVITLRKNGYQTRSYTVQIDDEEKDISYSFVDLVPGSDVPESVFDTNP